MSLRAAETELTLAKQGDHDDAELGNGEKERSKGSQGHSPIYFGAESATALPRTSDPLAGAGLRRRNPEQLLGLPDERLRADATEEVTRALGMLSSGHAALRRLSGRQ
jgi:hypothetical protein